MKDVSKLIFTFTVTQWYTMPDAMLKMAEIAHGEGVPVTWHVSLESAAAEKESLDRWHAEFGDEILLNSSSAEEFEQARALFPWAKLNVAGNPRMKSGMPGAYETMGVQGVWGFCDFQIGTDGVTHWGCPWGMFRLSDTSPLIPAKNGNSRVIGIPWTVRDIHKTYHLGQPINFCMDPVETMRSRTLDFGDNITLFANLFDELQENTAWNERVYCCLHEEADGAYVFPGQTVSNEGATPQEGQGMYEALRGWIRYAKENGARIMTLPEAVEDYERVSAGRFLSSTLLTRDKFHGRIKHYVPPLPEGVAFHEMGTAGHFPDTLFHYDEDCMLIFEHPHLQPETVLNYRAQYPSDCRTVYPKEQVLPCLFGWDVRRQGEQMTYEYRVTSWTSIPYGLAEWGDFRNWEIESTNCKTAKIVDDRVILLRFDIRTGSDASEAPQEVNWRVEEGQRLYVTLRRKSNQKGKS